MSQKPLPPNTTGRRGLTAAPAPRMRLLATALMVGLLTACATPVPPTEPAGDLPQQWHAPLPGAGQGALPHGGQRAALTDWWAQFDDPALTHLIDAAQRNNGSVNEAVARIAQARATLRSAGAAALPQADGGASVQRGRGNTGALATTRSVSIDTLWELDLMGGARASRSAALAQWQANQAAWHDARVSIAAETAQSYIGLRRCEQLVAVLQADAESLARTADLTDRKVRAGLESPANGALLRASAAGSAASLVAQQAQCESLVKSLVALTGTPEPDLRQRLAAGAQRLPRPQAFGVEAVPARWVAQRPDLRSIERQAAAALQEVDVAEADRWPRLSLLGSVGRTRSSGGGALAFEGTTWSVGPSLSIPLFDGQRRSAAVDAARARYDEARSRYAQRARDAVREVETALVDLNAAERRQSDAERAVEGYEAFLEAQRRRTESGAGSLLELEEARRTALAARSTLIGIQADRVLAWVDLYRAVGGGWTPDDPQTAEPSLAQRAPEQPARP